MKENIPMIDPEKKLFLDKLATYSQLSDIQSKIVGSTSDRRRLKADRRKLRTYIANDRRSGIVDRRKSKQKDF